MTTRMHCQRGATLLVALIMLVLLTLFAVSALNTSSTNLKVVGNMQARSEAFNASQQAIETVISSPLFLTNPANAVLNPCGTPNTLCTDVTGDGTPEYTTTLNPAPACVSVKVIQMSELDLVNKVDDRDCASETPQGSWGIFGAPTGNSLCANTVWEITAETTAAASGAKVSVTQGIGVRVTANAVTASCL